MKNYEFEVIGSGCKKCKELYELTKIVVSEINMTSSVLYSNDIGKIVTLGLVSSPVLTMDGKPILVGMLPNKNKLKEIITKEISSGQAFSISNDSCCSTSCCNKNC